jgi:hypothetical protein
MLRNRLQEVTHNPDIATHRIGIEAMRPVFHHTIDVITNENDNLAFNCVMFALGLEADAEYFAMATHCPQEVHASTQFLHFLADRGELVERQFGVPGSLIAYLEDGRFRHIGKMADDGRVRSKWGIGHLYEHAVFEVPASYGTTVRFFAPMALDDALDAFFAYAQACGVVFPRAEEY